MRVVVCMSGGVDSTVAAYNLKAQGHDVAGLTFWFWSFSEAPDYAGRTKCCALDLAARAADEVGIPHETVDASEAFRTIILDDFVRRYRSGETPNPCARCNRHVRFGLALEYAREHGFDAVATGHHVRITEEPDGSLALRRGLDPAKDQTYFLYALRQADLASLLFPVGEMTKADVVEIARRAKLSSAELPESQDLCFALRGETRFLFEDADFEPGPILDTNGRRLGEHEGLPNYTIGQRRGLGIATDRPLYVVRIDPGSNALIVGDARDLLSERLTAGDASYVSGTPPANEALLSAKIRYRSAAQEARFHKVDAASFDLAFSQPQRAITAGQIAAVYDGDRLLGGGTIARSGSRA
jgi:tRNA-specific 2-thiouridylase